MLVRTSQKRTETASMDESTLNLWRELVAMLEAELESPTLEHKKTAAALQTALEKKAAAEVQVASFILPQLDSHGEIAIRGWSAAHNALTHIWNSAESAFVDNLLPTFMTKAKPSDDV